MRRGWDGQREKTEERTNVDAGCEGERDKGERRGERGTAEAELGWLLGRGWLV
jgi:hypothetical protein